MSCGDCIKFWRWKKKTVKDKSRQPRISIWNQMYLLTSMSIFFEEFKDEHSQFSKQTTTAFDHKAVCIFDISDSTMQELELDAFYSFYLSQAQFEKAPRSLVTSRIHRFDFTETIRIYKILEEFHGSGLQDLSDRTKFKEFFTSFNFLPKYNRATAFNRFVSKPLTLFESVNIDENVKRTFDYDIHRSEWFQLMSWWRLVNTSLQESFKEAVRSLKTNETDTYFPKNAIEAVVRLDSLMADLGLNHESAELEASRKYLNLDKGIPDCTLFLPNYNFDFSTAKASFFQSVSEDMRWMAFSTGCGYYSINACFVVWKLLRQKSQDREFTNIVTETFRPLAIEFYYDVILPIGLKVNFGSYAISVVDKCVEYFKNVTRTLKEVRARNDLDPSPLDSTITLLTRMLFQLVDIIFEDIQVTDFFGEKATFAIKISVYNFLLNKMKNAILLTHKVFQKDFITESLLSKLSKLVPGTLSTSMHEISYAQLAYSLLTAYKVMHRTHPIPESCIRLRSNFPSRDFMMFIDELRRTSALQELDTEKLSTEFTVRLQAMQHRFTAELESDLCNITDLAQEANEILNTVKYFL